MTDASIKRIHERMDGVEGKADRLGVIIRGNGDSGMRGKMIQLDGRIETIETYIKDQKTWTRALVMFGIAQLVGIIVLLTQ